MKKLLLSLSAFSFVTFFCFAFTSLNLVYADCDPSDNSCKQLQDIHAQISKLEGQITDAKNQEKTLTSQLNLIDGQTKVTTLKIEETNLNIEKLKREISDLSTRIDRIGVTLDSLSEILLGRIVETYKYNDTVSTFNLIFSSQNFANLIERLKYIQVAQAYDKKKLYELQATKMAYNDQQQDKKTRQAEAEKLSKDLETYQKQLDDQKKTKDALLNETQNNETTYQRLLAQAQAELAGFASFAASRGGASLLSGQTTCDDWGCYYNQRDSQWGGNPLNGTNYTLATDGCLITSVAMVFTHYGHKGVTPQTINNNSGNFATYEPAFLNKTASADGATLTRNSNHSVSDIDNLLSGGPVIVRISYSNGDTHFVVLVSGSSGNYKMNDPFIPSGHSISFTDHYSISSITEVDQITIQ